MPQGQDSQGESSLKKKGESSPKKKMNMLGKWNHNAYGIRGWIKSMDTYGGQQWVSTDPLQLLVQAGHCFCFPPHNRINTKTKTKTNKPTNKPTKQHLPRTGTVLIHLFMHLYTALCCTFIHFRSCKAINLIWNNYFNSSRSHSHQHKPDALK